MNTTFTTCATKAKQFLNLLQGYTKGIRITAILILLLMGVSNAWADDGDFYNTYLTYTFGATSGSAQDKDNGTGLSKDLGTLNSGSFKITAVYLKCWDDWGSNYKSSGGQMCYSKDGGATQYLTGFSRSNKAYNSNNYEWRNTNANLTIANSTDKSGSYTLSCWFQTWGWGDRFFPKSSGNYTFTYKIAPPSVKGFTVTPSGNKLSGSGTQADPYIVTTMSDFMSAVAEDSVYVRLANNIYCKNEYLRYQIEGLRNLLFRAAKANSNNPIALYNLSRYFVQTKETNLIEQTLKDCIEKFNALDSIKRRDIYKYIDSYRLLGEYYIDTQDYLQALEQFAEGIHLYTTERDNAGFEGNKQIGKLYEDFANIKYFVVLAYRPIEKNKTPYFDFSDTIYPDVLATVPVRYAIDKRNRWMIDKSDYVISFVKYHGGAAKFTSLAEKKGKTVINLASINLD